MYSAARCLLFRVDPETAHQLSLMALKSGLPIPVPRLFSPRLHVKAAGLEFANPLGIAAGFDKNAEVADELFRLGFGFVEVGTVTPIPQEGNPKPRLFRLPRDRAVLNRLGFNNHGHAAVLARLKKCSHRDKIGINLGSNRNSTDRLADYERGIESFAGVAAYFAINVSSPNTPGLRKLQSREQLTELLGRCRAARDRSAANVPIFVKLAPDLDQQDLEDIAIAVQDLPIEGIIVSNTTLHRGRLNHSEFEKEDGGLSGEPLFERSTIILARLRSLLGPDIAMIGVGGVHSIETALEKFRAGADLVQLYTGMIYEGPGLPGRILSGLDQHLAANGIKNLREIRDSSTVAWAARNLV